MNLLLPDLDRVPVDLDAEDAQLDAAPVAPSDVPDWLLPAQVPMTALVAVMRHPAEQINEALAATRTNDVQALLEHLAWVR